VHTQVVNITYGQNYSIFSNSSHICFLKNVTKNWGVGLFVMRLETVCCLFIEIGIGVLPVCHEAGNTTHLKCQLPLPFPYPHTAAVDSVKSAYDVVHMWSAKQYERQVFTVLQGYEAAYVSSFLN
jgi:hypothetical protein